MSRDLWFQNQYQFVKSEGFETFCVSKHLIWRKKWSPPFVDLAFSSLSPRVGNSLPFSPKYTIPRQIKPQILETNIARGQSNFSIVLFFVSCEEKDFNRVISVGQPVLRAQPAYERHTANPNPSNIFYLKRLVHTSISPYTAKPR